MSPRTLAPALLVAFVSACNTSGDAARDAAASPTASSQAPGDGTADDPRPPTTFDVAAIDAYVGRALASGHLIGLSLAIARDGQVVLARGYGEARREDHVPVDLDTEFGVGSITKQFTCASALLLESDHKLAMTDRVARYFPALTRAGDISLADLGAHLSGYPDYYPLDFVDSRMREPTTQDGILARYATGKLDFEPGSRWSYSNTGFTLLGRVVEKVAGEPLAAVFAKRLFEPVGMAHAAYSPKDGPGVARGYTSFALGDPEPAVPEADDWRNGAGAIFASASDLAKWDLALVSGKVLPPAQYAELTTSRVLPDGRSTQYGCGIGVRERIGETVLSHNGGIAGFLAFNAVVPRTRSAVVLLSNYDGASADGIFQTILSLVLDASRPPSPTVLGPPAGEVVRAFVAQLQKGQVDRTRFGREFNAYLTDARVREASARLSALGPPTDVKPGTPAERGGMEVTETTLTLGGKKLRASMYRSPDGSVQQILLYPD